MWNARTLAAKRVIDYVGSVRSLASVFEEDARVKRVPCLFALFFFSFTPTLTPEFALSQTPDTRGN